jgi:hypothetical protein
MAESMRAAGAVSFAGIEAEDGPMRVKPFAFLASFVLTAAVLAPAPGQAAPQILGLIASAQPVPMTCVNGTCTAELSAVCLQQHRPTPSTGTVYRPAKGTQIALTVTASNGEKRRLEIAPALSFESLRQYNAVKVSLPEATVRQLGGGEPSLSVPPMASLVPVAVEGDPEPLSAAEIARYTGPLRGAAERAFERDSDRVNATRILNQMVNRLPEGGDRAGTEDVEPLWQRTVDDRATAQTKDYLKRAVKDCREALRTGVLPGLRSCLSYQHDYLSGENTNNAWQAMNPGT